MSTLPPCASQAPSCGHSFFCSEVQSVVKNWFILVSLSGYASVRVVLPSCSFQDAYFRMTRDVAPRMKLRKPALIHSRFFPGLQVINHVIHAWCAPQSRFSLATVDTNSSQWLNIREVDARCFRLRVYLIRPCAQVRRTLSPRTYMIASAHFSSVNTFEHSTLRCVLPDNQ